MRPTREPRSRGAGELDLVPIMNLVTILIPFLLLSTRFVDLAAIDSALPALSSDTTPTPPDGPQLKVDVTRTGYRVHVSDSRYPEPVDLPCPGACRGPDTYDTGGLVEVLAGIKDAWPDEDELVLVPDARVSYEVLVLTMDTARRSEDGTVLFPAVSLAGGV